MQTKRRILLVNDAHFLHTGYGKYGWELLTRLARTKKYEIAELACYGSISDNRDIYAEWNYYANEAVSGHPLHRLYTAHPQNQFGRWRFERVLLDFKPDIVIDIRDAYMFAFEFISPLRPFFHWIIMPPIDSAPQKEEWLDIYHGADTVVTYEDYGAITLAESTHNRLTSVTNTPPGVDIDVYQPVANKAGLRKQMGLFGDCNIVGTVMRNQQRKLYPELFIMFRQFIDTCYKKGLKDLADKTYLYVHTSYPDMGWEIPSLIKEHGLGRKVIFTYVCKSCGLPSCSFFKDAKTVCNRCNNTTAFLPNSKTGVEPFVLSQIYNAFDVYIQYSNCEGFGMPIAEAASCGIPIMAVDYSAMSDLLKKTGGIPIKVDRMFRDFGADAYRALPDNTDTVNQLISFLKKPDPMKRIMGHKARKAVEQYYTWDNTAKAWEDVIDNAKLTDLHGKWDAPMRNCQKIVGFNPQEHLSKPDYVKWLFSNVMQEPELVNSRLASQYLKQLNYGMKIIGQEFHQVNRKTLYDLCRNYAESKLEAELARTGKIELINQDFIEYAHMRARFLQ